MVDKNGKPDSLADFKGKVPHIEVTTEATDPADVEATRALLEQYTQIDGFHCPRCPFTTKNPDEAVRHLAQEMNKALLTLRKPPK